MIRYHSSYQNVGQRLTTASPTLEDIGISSKPGRGKGKAPGRVRRLPLGPDIWGSHRLEDTPICADAPQQCIVYIVVVYATSENGYVKYLTTSRQLEWSIHTMNVPDQVASPIIALLAQLQDVGYVFVVVNINISLPRVTFVIGENGNITWT